MKITIASGKGGTGKTTVAVNLAETINSKVTLVDCDVEEPNDHLFFNGKIIESLEVTTTVPHIQASLCSNCGKCSEFCQFNAIASFINHTMVFPELCHSCQGCHIVCPTNAIYYIPRRIGVIESIEIGKNLLIQGKLDVGIPSATPLVRFLKKQLNQHQLVIIDAPPGTSCPVVASIQNSDYVLLVTEPTPFGLNDLILTVDLVRELKIPFGVVVNRYGIGDDHVQQFCNKNKISILANIPNDKRIAETYSCGGLIVEKIPEYQITFQNLFTSILKEMSIQDLVA